jgi:sulfite exporter TauE/SafE
MDKIKNSFALGILFGLISCILLLVILDVAIYFIHRFNGIRGLESDVIFAISTLAALLLARKFSRMDGKQELGKGFLFSAFIWGAIYVFLFLIKDTKTLFFIS